MNEQKNINDISGKGRTFAAGLKQRGTSDLSALKRSVAAACRELQHINEDSASGRRLADERYMVFERARGAQSALKKTKKLRAASGTPLVLLCAREYLRLCAWSGDAASLDEYLTGFQSALPLEHEELWMLPALFAALITLRLGNAASKGGDRQEVSNCLVSLRTLSALKLKTTLRKQDLLDHALLQDPAGVYEKMTREGRGGYCALLARLAKEQRIDQLQAANIVLELASKGTGRQRHVGYYLLERPLGAKRKSCAVTYKTAVCLGTAAVTVGAACLAHSALAAPLVLLPAWDLWRKVVKGAAARFVKPLPVASLDYTKHVPKEGKTVCAVSCLLTDKNAVTELVNKLEDLKLANPECAQNVIWTLLADLPDGEELQKEEEAELIRFAARHIERLNELHSGGFVLFTRPRMFSRREGRYMAPERKRGAIEELVGFLSSAPSAVHVEAGEPSLLEGARFILALDSDTVPFPGSVANLIGTMAHPLNRPVAERGRVVKGWGVIVPRQEVRLSDSEKSIFSRAMAGQGGWDAYAPADVRQLVFDRSGFSGKGLIDIEAYKQCLWGRIPRGRVLSHDLLEGEYLRAGYVPHALFCDGFPSRFVPYCTRLHRWTRGDWQSLPWVLAKVRVPGGIKRNPLGFDSKLRILENAARSLVGPSCLALTLLAVFGVLPPWLALASLVGSVDSIKGAVISLTKAPKAGQRAIMMAKEQLIGAVLRLAFLVHESFVSLSAAATALVRMLFTRRNMLQWVTAAQADRDGTSFFGYFKKMCVTVAVGAAVMVFAQSIWSAALGALWFLSPAAAYFVSTHQKREKPLPEQKKRWLLLQAKKMLAYFEDNMTAQNNWLPPDNVQTSPHKGTATRTSPTNIGLALLSCLSACRMGIWDEDKSVTLMEKCLNTIGKLEKWRGHLYNWYSTQTLEPLKPADISSVDSGNLCACLVAVEEGLRRMESPAAERCALMAAQLVGEMDFTPLYDEERRQLRISRRPNGEPTDNCYDLLSSEARLTSFVTIALGKTDKRIWQSLGRACCEAGGLRPLASWSGTMFEYLMPRILLPEKRGSLLDFSARDCVKVQQKNAAADGLWGISESCYYAFDETLDYQYKAHGVQALAIGRCRRGERVISPYSSYLALEIDPEAALKNLERLEQLGAVGKWGLYEAVDMTEGRGASGKAAVVACHMAHHLGMSITAVCNFLCDGALREYFCSNRAVRAWLPLLDERAPLVPSVVEASIPYDMPTGGARRRQPVLAEGLGLGQTDACILSNGLFSIVCDRTGRQSIRCGGAEVTQDAVSWQMSSSGVDRTLTPWPGFEGEYTSSFSTDSFAFATKFDTFSAELETAVVRSQPGFVQQLTIKNNSDEDKTVTVKVSFTPVLEGAAAYYSHPAFSKLFLGCEQKHDGALVTRAPRGRQRKAYLFAALSRPGVRPGLLRPGRGGNGCGDECAVSFELEVPVFANSIHRLRLALCLGDEEMAAVDGAKYCLEHGFDERSDREKEFMSLGGSAPFDARCALELLRRVQWPSRVGALGSREELYLHGISGDLPIVSAAGRGEYTEKLLLANRFLAYAGRPFDLVLFLPEEGYGRPEYNALLSLMRRLDCEHRLKVRGGVHIVPTQRQKIISSLSNAVWPPEPLEPLQPRRMTESAQGEGMLSFKTEGERAVLELCNCLPDAVWSVPLANESFGTLAADCGFMGSWYKNARENRLTPWVNEPAGTEGSESIDIITPQGKVSAFAAVDGWNCRVVFEPGLVRWIKTRGEAKIETRAWVAQHAPARVISIKTEGIEDAKGEYHTRIIMGSALNEGEHTIYTPTVGGFEAIDLYNGAFAGQRALILGPSGTVDASGVRMSFDAKNETVIVLGCFMTPQEERAIRDLASKPCEPDTIQKPRVSIKTPSKAIDNYVNHWALYQTKVCRLWGRCSVYQCGGAYGFRDQLQDVCALLWSEPELAKQHILLCCARQFEEGDCAHWWHELSDGVVKGVRTLCSDDLLWLPYAAALYVRSTGDHSLLSLSAPWLTAPPLAKGERDRYEQLKSTDYEQSVYEHCLRAIDCALRRGFGSHSLPLILGGDWNDGMDSVGIDGRGESVWLAWFMVLVLKEFAPLCEAAERDRLLKQADLIEQAARSAWDGEWYLRGYFDSGEPLGSKDSPECRIDAIAQGFAALSSTSDDKTITALKSACEQLMRPEAVALFTPPFEGKGPFPGYISAYPPGVRENGGQYTHGAIWLAMGCMRAGLKKEGLAILEAIAPKGVYDSRYGAEPWVIAADVSLKKGFEGKAGWSWYTGSAGWFYRAVLEELLGLRLEGGSITWDASRLPPGWSEENVSILVDGQPIRPFTSDEK